MGIKAGSYPQYLETDNNFNSAQMFQHSRHNHFRHFRNELQEINSCDRLVNEINFVSTSHIKCKWSRAQHNRRIAGYKLVSWLKQKNYSLADKYTSTITMVVEIRVKQLHDLQCFRELNFVTFARFVFAKNSLPPRSNVKVTTIATSVVARRSRFELKHCIHTTAIQEQMFRGLFEKILQELFQLTRTLKTATVNKYRKMVKNTPRERVRRTSFVEMKP